MGFITFTSFHVPCHMTHRGGGVAWCRVKAAVHHTPHCHNFGPVYVKETSQICLAWRVSYGLRGVLPSIADIKFDVDEVYKVLCGIDPSKACGPDEIPG